MGRRKNKGRERGRDKGWDSPVLNWLSCFNCPLLAVLSVLSGGMGIVYTMIRK